MMRACFVEWVRRSGGLLAAFGLGVLLAGCGGGGSNSNGLVAPFGEVVISPSVVSTGPNAVWTFTISGGVRPYRVRSSSSLVVLEKQDLALNEFTVRARALDPRGQATVVVTVVDSLGDSTDAYVTISSATVSPLAALPATITAYFNTPALLVASGGLPPYRILSSNPAIIPSSSWSQSGDFMVLARNVGAETLVGLVLQDSSGQAVEVAVTVKPAPLLNVFTVTPVPAAPGVGCGTAVCSGQEATASVTLRSFEGGALPGRQVRFDVVQGEYLFFSDNPAQPLVSSMIVTSDQNGLAIVRLKANTNAVTGAALIRATDLVTGNQVNGNFVIAQYTDGTGTISVLPNATTIQAYYDDECSSGVSGTLYIFGGTPPYRVVSEFPNDLPIVGAPVLTNGGGFTFSTRGVCLLPAVVIVTDATGRTVTATVRNEPGTHEREDDNFSPQPLAVTPTAATLKCGESASFTITGGINRKYVAAALSPLVRATITGETATVAMGTTAPAGAAVNVDISDGRSIVPVAVTPSGCP